VNVLVYAEEYKYVEDAIAREKQLKGWSRAKKDALVTSANPSWADLLETLPVILLRKRLERGCGGIPGRIA